MQHFILENNFLDERTVRLAKFNFVDGPKVKAVFVFRLKFSGAIKRNENISKSKRFLDLAVAAKKQNSGRPNNTFVF